MYSAENRWPQESQYPNYEQHLLETNKKEFSLEIFWRQVKTFFWKILFIKSYELVFFSTNIKLWFYGGRSDFSARNPIEIIKKHLTFNSSPVNFPRDHIKSSKVKNKDTPTINSQYLSIYFDPNPSWTAK